MHPDPAFRMADEAAMRAFVAERAFATISACVDGRPVVAHAPVEVAPGVDGGADRLRFHLSRRNTAAAGLDGATAIVSVLGADGYVSPDWYGTPDQVPTWNYGAVEAHGLLRVLAEDELVAQLDALSDAAEARLLPKPVWRREKMMPGRFAAMLGGITGYELAVREWRGTAKYSQNKSAAQRAGVVAAYRALGRGDLADLVGQPA